MGAMLGRESQSCPQPDVQSVLALPSATSLTSAWGEVQEAQPIGQRSQLTQGTGMAPAVPAYDALLASPAVLQHGFRQIPSVAELVHSPYSFS